MLGTVKRGDTFAFTVQIRSADGEPLIGAADNLKCQGRYYWNEDVLVELTISETETPGTYLFRAGNTDSWLPQKTVNFDIQYSNGKSGDSGKIS